eukprot:1161421-Pelagomonas_calceolata.AAC.7
MLASERLQPVANMGADLLVLPPSHTLLLSCVCRSTVPKPCPATVVSVSHAGAAQQGSGSQISPGGLSSACLCSRVPARIWEAFANRCHHHSSNVGELHLPANMYAIHVRHMHACIAAGRLAIRGHHRSSSMGELYLPANLLTFNDLNSETTCSATTNGESRSALLHDVRVHVLVWMVVCLCVRVCMCVSVCVCSARVAMGQPAPLQCKP